MRARCQICGRQKPLRADGAVRAHYRSGQACPGGGASPWPAADVLRAEAARLGEQERRWQAAYLRHADERRNAPFEGFDTWHAVAKECGRLKRRLSRWEREQA